MTTSERQWWEQERAKGRSHFLVRRGLLRAGLPFGVFVVTGKVLYSFFAHQPIAPAWRILVEFGFYVLGFGALMGVWSWQTHESDYKKPAEEEDGA